jgi:peptidoglycan-associated lipoprotein
MKRVLAKSGAIILMGIVLLLNQGCSTKLAKSESEGERVSGSVDTKLPPISEQSSSDDMKVPPISQQNSGNDMKLPPITSEQSSSGDMKVPPQQSSDNDMKLPPIASEQSPNGELSGFSRNPSEERLAEGGYLGALPPSGIAPRQRAERTTEEKAAVEAGLQDVFFGFDQWALSDAGMDALNHGATYLNNHPTAMLKIEGHCDERGSADYNMVLGDKRAKAARNYLVEALVKPKQLAIVSYGKERPFCLDHDESCYEQNRRDHMLLTVNE